MANKQIIRKNIITGEWEHYVDVPLFDNYHWAPGIFDYYGEFPVTTESQSLVRNGEDFLLSYEDVVYKDYEVTSKRKLPRYTDVKNIYDIRFDELYTPSTELSIFLAKKNRGTDTLDIEATIIGGYPYRHPDVHYDFYWTARNMDTTFIDAYNNSKNTLILKGVGTGFYKISVRDANRIFNSEAIRVSQSDFLNVKDDQGLGVRLFFYSSDTIAARGTLRAVISSGNSTSPYTIEWKRGGVDGGIILEETVEIEPNVKKIIDADISVGLGTYSIVVKSADGQEVTQTIEVTTASFPEPDPGEDVYGDYSTNPEEYGGGNPKPGVE